jgi:hypothetical protein
VKKETPAQNGKLENIAKMASGEIPGAGLFFLRYIKTFSGFLRKS